MAGNGETQAGPAIIARGRRFGLRKCLEQAARLFRSHTDSAVGDRKTDHIAVRSGNALGRQRNAAVLGEFAGIAEKIKQALA